MHYEWGRGRQGRGGDTWRGGVSGGVYGSTSSRCVAVRVRLCPARTCGFAHVDVSGPVRLNLTLACVFHGIFRVSTARYFVRVVFASVWSCFYDVGFIISEFLLNTPPKMWIGDRLALKLYNQIKARWFVFKLVPGVTPNFKLNMHIKPL